MSKHLVELPPLWSMESRRAKAEVEHKHNWENMSLFVSNVLGSGTTLRNSLRKGEWAMRDWLIEGLLRRNSVSLFVGESGVGKTMILLDLAYSVATGQKWLSHYECCKGPVVFLAGESSMSALESRLIGLNHGRGKTAQWLQDNGLDFLTIIAQRELGTSNFPLSNEEWWKKAELLLAQSIEGAKPILWIFDPIISLVKDPDKEESREVMSRCFQLATQSNGHVLLAHHTRKPPSGKVTERQNDRIRGDSSWRNLADDILFFEKVSPGFTSAFLNKARDEATSGEDHPLFHIKSDFSGITGFDFFKLLEAYNIENNEMAVPGSIKNISLQWVPYVEKATEEYTDTSVKKEELEEEKEEQEEPRPKQSAVSRFAATIREQNREAPTNSTGKVNGTKLELLPSDGETEEMGEEEEDSTSENGRIRLKGKRGNKEIPEDGQDAVGTMILQILESSNSEALSLYQIWSNLKASASGVGQSRIQNRLDKLHLVGHVQIRQNEKGALVYSSSRKQSQTAEEAF